LDKAAVKKLTQLRSDYATVVGRPFAHFYCPILFRDEDASLCRAHIINRAFRGSSRRWTIQREDVDSFYGSAFESDFIPIQERGKHDPLDVCTDKHLTRSLEPRILLNGKEVPHYMAHGQVPSDHSEFFVTGARKSVRLGLKLQPSEALAALDAKWEIYIEKDVRMAALGSLLKAAHLTLFDMLGYRYALSAGGHFLGHDVLGTFFLANVGQQMNDVLRNAERHFLEFVNLVRPLLQAPKGLVGTVSDKLMYLCMNGDRPWAVLVLIRTGDLFHSVLAPVFEDDDGAARFVSFLTRPSPRIEVKLTRFCSDRWEVSKNSTSLVWPEANFS